MPISKQTYGEQVVQYIKQSIRAGTLRPGDRISEEQLAKELSVSRAPIREAMQTLANEGVLVSAPHKGKRITEMSPQEIRDSYFIGGALEGALAASSLSAYTEEDFRNLADIAERMRTSQQDPVNVEMLEALDNEFHGIIFSRTSSRMIVDIIRRSCQGVSKLLYYPRWKRLFSRSEVYERHQKIIDALRSGDVARIETTFRDHYNEIGERMSRGGRESG
ncbi:GntR family transcriptional regulator [Desulfovibrio aminophilus]|nr:GntR family transcriptional regulator [Desulfovibrio aminophilus]MCM0755044.1 GntR family transcriptional regulator [Desulfovibrio aminophilus]